MTKIGLEHIADAIINRIVEVPDDLALRDLTAWLNGYAKCQNDILEVIGRYMEYHCNRAMITYATVTEKEPSSQPELQWIPCSERLPDHTGTYLVTTIVAVDKYVTTGWYSTKGGWICDGCTVLAWTPLPEPYKEEENNSDKSGWDPLWDGR